MKKGTQSLLFMLPLFLDLQLFAEAGTVVNTYTGDVNAYTGSRNATTALESQRKIYYDTTLLKNTYPRLRYSQLGKKQALPQNHGQTLEFRRPNRMPYIDKLIEGVIPEGKKIGMTSKTVPITEYGAYFAVTKQVRMHTVDPIVQTFTEELARSAAETIDVLVRNELMTNTNVMFADVKDANGNYASTPTSTATMATALGTAGNKAVLTPDACHLATTQLRATRVPFFSGNDFVAVIHPNAAYDLTRDDEWSEWHKYTNPEAMYNGEIGKLHGCRFVETDLAPVMEVGGQKLFCTMFFGKEAFAVIDVDGSSMETIIKSEREAGGPLNQFGTVGCKCETASVVLYTERVLLVWHSCTLAAKTEANYTLPAGS